MKILLAVCITGTLGALVFALLGVRDAAQEDARFRTTCIAAGGHLLSSLCVSPDGRILDAR